MLFYFGLRVLGTEEKCSDKHTYMECKHVSIHYFVSTRILYLSFFYYNNENF